jgi:hypothetical protein
MIMFKDKTAELLKMTITKPGGSEETYFGAIKIRVQLTDQEASSLPNIGQALELLVIDSRRDEDKEGPNSVKLDVKRQRVAVPMLLSAVSFDGTATIASVRCEFHLNVKIAVVEGAVSATMTMDIPALLKEEMLALADMVGVDGNVMSLNPAQLQLPGLDVAHG